MDSPAYDLPEDPWGDDSPITTHTLPKLSIQQPATFKGAAAEDRLSNDNLERQILSCCLTDQDRLSYLTELKPQLFTGFDRPKLLGFLFSMIEEGLDIGVHSVRSYLQLQGIPRKQQITEELDRIIGTPLLEPPKNLIAHLQDYARNRLIQEEVLNKTKNMFAQGLDSEEIFRHLTKTLLQTTDTKKNVTIKEATRSAAHTIIYNPESTQGLDSGIDEFDNQFCGFIPDRNWVIAAESSAGKTATAIDLIYRLCVRHKDKIAMKFFSFEMSQERVSRRLISRHAGLTEDRMKQKMRRLTDEEVEKVKEADALISDFPLEVDYESMSIQQMKLRAQRFALEHKDKHLFFIIDHLGKLAEQHHDQRKGMVDASAAAKSFCMDHNATTLTLAQLGKAVSQDPSRRNQFCKPFIGDIMEAVNVRQDADNVLLLWRPDMYFDKIPYAGMQEWPTKGKIIYLNEKNRDGAAPSDIILDCNIGCNHIMNPYANNPFAP